MKLIRMFGRCIRDAFKSVIRNFSLSLASISCITITLIIVTVALIASFNVRNFTSIIEKDMTIVVFLKNDASKKDAEKVEEKIKKINNVSEYEFFTKNQVKEQLQEESPVFNTVLENFEDGDNPLKDTFQVKVKDINQISTTARTIEKMKDVAVVRYGEGMVDKMVKAFASIERVTYGIVIALVLVTIFLIVNTIKLTISSRKKEIEIMRLVGASNFTIKTPFIIEGMFLGLLGSIIPIIISTYGYIAFYRHFNGYLYSELIKLIIPEPFIYQISLILLGTGILVGMIGSARAVRKYLKV